jgi:RNA polymerase sigma-70 factor (ECF subfamily)
MGSPSLIGNDHLARCWARPHESPRTQARRPSPRRPPGRAGGAGLFPPTQWTDVLGARAGADVDHRREAMTRLIDGYWRPVFFLVRRRHDAEAARDLTQGFFAAFLERDFLQYVDRARGKFRVFLRTALDHYLADEWDRACAEKRGGARPHLPLDFAQVDGEASGPAADDDPERLFRRKWAVAVMGRALEAVQGEYRASDRAQEFEVLGGRLVEGASPTATYAALAARLGWSEHDVNNRLHRMRKLYRDAIWRELRALTADDAQAEEELRELFSAVAR